MCRRKMLLSSLRRRQSASKANYSNNDPETERSPDLFLLLYNAIYSDKGTAGMYYLILDKRIQIRKAIKMKKAIALLLVLVALCLMLVSCGGSQNAIVGTWVSRDLELPEGYNLVFKEDGTGVYFGEDIKYKTDGDKLSIWWEGTESFDTTFKVNGDELCFKDSNGEDVYWVRSK